MSNLIALTGLIASGKSTIATHLVRHRGFQLVKFAGGLKQMLRALFDYTGEPPDLVEEMLEGLYKEAPTSLLEGKTPRLAMQTLGTEWGRECIGKDFWANITAARIHGLLTLGTSVVVDDCRYPNEAGVIGRLGGEVWKIHRHDVRTKGHPTEHEQRHINPDRILMNNGSVEELLAAVDIAAGRLASAQHKLGVC